MITHAQTKLPSPYRKLAEITFALRMGVWITIAHFSSGTSGTVPAFFLRKHNAAGTFKEISANVYYNLVRFYANGRTKPAA